MKTIIDNVLVIKVGTSTLTKKRANGSEELDSTSFQRLGDQFLKLQRHGYNVVVVSSAAISAGMMATDLKVRPSKTKAMPSLQRLASIGWRHVLNAWDQALFGVNLGEILLTKQELDLPTERDEALRVTYELMSHDDIIIANENDAITHAEIAFGDNDALAATFATKIKQSGCFGNRVKLIILSDVNGVYENARDAGTLIPTIKDMAQFEHLALGTTNSNGTGGMVTKFAAAKIAVSNGIETYIANGREENVIEKALAGSSGTRFIC